MFGLTPFMPSSHEQNPINTPKLQSQWGEDLIWSWRAGTHSVHLSGLNYDIGWENDHTEIARVCQELVKVGPNRVGRRHFFYQTMNGYWDAHKNRFQFGEHPEGKLWDVDGNLVTDLKGYADLTIRNAVRMSLSEWKATWNEHAVDFLMNQHSPRTSQTL